MVSLEEWFKVHGHGLKRESSERDWFEAVVQLMPAPPGLRAITTSTSHFDNTGGVMHVPVVALGLRRDGKVVTVPPLALSIGWCVEGMYVGDSDGEPRPCPACASEASAARLST
jgi:hypothetical protein